MDYRWSQPIIPLETPLRSLPANADQRLHQLLEVWAECGWIQDPPDRTELSAERLKRWLGNLSIYKTGPDQSDFVIALEGSEITRMTGQDCTKRTASEIDKSYGSTLLQSLRDTLHLQVPVMHSIRVFQKQFIQGTRVLFPVRSGRGHPPDQVFLALYRDRTIMSQHNKIVATGQDLITRQRDVD